MRPDPKLNLDVDTPNKVSAVLRAAANAYCLSAGELYAAWQDSEAGKAWEVIARELERAADRIDTKLNKG